MPGDEVLKSKVALPGFAAWACSLKWKVSEDPTGIGKQFENPTPKGHGAITIRNPCRS